MFAMSSINEISMKATSAYTESMVASVVFVVVSFAFGVFGVFGSNAVRSTCYAISCNTA